MAKTHQVVCDTAKVRFFKQITTGLVLQIRLVGLFAILQKYDFSSKSQQLLEIPVTAICCLRYCKSTIFQANHNVTLAEQRQRGVVCDTAKVRFFKQITTGRNHCFKTRTLFAILQKYDFSSKSQLDGVVSDSQKSCLRYCKSTIFQANHNPKTLANSCSTVVCDTAKVRFFKQITTKTSIKVRVLKLFAILQKYDFSSKSQLNRHCSFFRWCCLRYCKSTIFQANHNLGWYTNASL